MQVLASRPQPAAPYHSSAACYGCAEGYGPAGDHATPPAYGANYGSAYPAGYTAPSHYTPPVAEAAPNAGACGYPSPNAAPNYAPPPGQPAYPGGSTHYGEMPAARRRRPSLLFLGRGVSVCLDEPSPLWRSQDITRVRSTTSILRRGAIIHSKAREQPPTLEHSLLGAAASRKVSFHARLSGRYGRWRMRRRGDHDVDSFSLPTECQAR